MKIVIYSMGQALGDRLDLLDYKDIVAFADKYPTKEKLCGIPVVGLKQLKDVDYDFVVVFSNRYYDEIVKELQSEAGVSGNKILAREQYLNGNRAEISQNTAFIREYLQANEYKRILCSFNIFTDSDYVMREQFMPDASGRVDLVSNGDDTDIRGLFDHLYCKFSGVGTGYDAAVLKEGDLNRIENVKCLARAADVILLQASYRNEQKICDILTQYGDIRKITTRTDRFVELVTNRAIKNNCKIYMVMHKPYQVQEDDLYTPICVGGYEWEGHLHETDGVNIAYLNRKINECTALYWIWKNTSEPYVGMCHYRRYLYNGRPKETWNRLNAYHINILLRDYDLVLSEVAQTPPGQTLHDFIRDSIDVKAFDIGYYIVRDAIKIYQPDYLKAFDVVMRGKYRCVCNLFVAERGVIERYCEWLFSFLIEAAERMDITSFDPYSSRVIGFFAECMWMVWLKRNRVRVKFLPYDEIVVNPNEWSVSADEYIL